MHAARHGGNLARPLALALAATAWLCAGFVPAAGAAVLGLVTDNAGRHVAVFDAATDQVSHRMAPTPGHANGDCAVSAQHALGVASNSAASLALIELDGREPGVEMPVELAISNLGVDMALSPDGQLLVAAGGGALQQPLAVVSLATRSEIATARPFVDHTSVEFCDDGTLLLTTTHGRLYAGPRDNALYTAQLAGDGGLQLDGRRLTSGASPNNSACAPGARSGVLLDREGGITAFSLPGLEVVAHERTREGMALSAAFSDDGRRLYVRTERHVEAFDFDPENGALQRDWTRAVPAVPTFYGMEQLVVHPAGAKLYVDGGSELLVLDTTDGEPLGTLETGDATGVCLAQVEVVAPLLAVAAGGDSLTGIAAP